MRIGVLGGTFDPIHYGHLILAETIRNEAMLDKVIFIPAKVSPFKQNYVVASGEHRIKMAEIATDGYDKFEVSGIEFSIESVSYTINTLHKLQKQLNKDDKMYYITGTDAIMSIERWKSSEALLKEFSFIVGTRYIDDMTDPVEHIKYLVRKYGTNIRIINMPLIGISSTLIKNLLSEGKSIKYLLPDGVEEYIKENGLYK